MMTEEIKKLDPAPLVKLLIEKSKAGKLDWEPTADRQQFVTSVGGDTTFKIRLVSITDINEYGQPETEDVPRLEMLDQQGHSLWQVQGGDMPIRELRELFEIARRIGNRLDARVAGAIDALDKL
jgi:hypothetical protein